MALRTRVAGEFPAVTSARSPADYVADDVGTGTPGDPDFVPGTDAQRRGCRGTVEHDNKNRNYSFHVVTFDLGGQARIVRDRNFSFARLRVRDAGSIEFRDCNLTGARWRSVDGATITFLRCNTGRGGTE